MVANRPPVETCPGLPEQDRNSGGRSGEAFPIWTTPYMETAHERDGGARRPEGRSTARDAPDNLTRGRYIVRAVIEAMRLGADPMCPIIEAVQTEVDIWPEDKPRPAPNFVQFVSHEEAVAIWNAGIDAALK